MYLIEKKIRTDKMLVLKDKENCVVLLHKDTTLNLNFVTFSAKYSHETNPIYYKVIPNYLLLKIPCLKFC